jgi:hypothetical protein
MLYRKIIAVCSEIHSKHKYTVWAECRYTYFTDKHGSAKINIRRCSVAQNTSNDWLVQKKNKLDSMFTEVVVASLNAHNPRIFLEELRKIANVP